jgi:hypothetical protein
MRIETLALSISEREATDWLGALLAEAGVQAVCVTFVTGAVELAGRATRPFPVPFTVLLRPRVKGQELWFEVESVQAVGPLGSWLQGPLLALAANRLADFGVRQEGRALGVDAAQLLGQGKRQVHVDHLDVGVDMGRLKIAASGNLALG